MPAEPFVLLDDCTASEGQPSSRLYSGFRRMLACDDASGLPALLQQMQHGLDQGLHAVLLLDYELGERIEAIAPRPGAASSPTSAVSAARILLFDDCRRLSSDAVAAWLEAAAGAADADVGIAGIEFSEDEAAFTAAIARIHAYIEAGDVYQINHTFRIRFDAFGPPAALYRRLRARQPVPYGALALLPDGSAILSLSPELFMRNVGGMLVAQPMKGTLPASGDAAVDAARARELASDAKSRAENLMIVDLLRNDFGRIARTGSVTVPALFQVERHGALLQMTSTIHARLRDGVTLAETLAALFPCGSVTGAPKRRAMQIIRELEGQGRGIYTGAIGWVEAGGDFCFSVAIRTLALAPPSSPCGVRRGMLGVGAGIVHDSRADAEYAECLHKAAFATGLGATFTLIESLHASREGGCRHLERHLDRLRRSARYFGFVWREESLRTALMDACAALPDGVHALRIVLGADGKVELAASALAPWQEPVRLLLAHAPTDADDPFLRHKTSRRVMYDAAWRKAGEQGAFDMLFFNTRGELTEGGRSNVFLRIDGAWYTPPLSSGLLPGVMRAVLLDDPVFGASERVLRREDVRRAEQIMVCNALRGPLRAVLDGAS
ncbi:aminodeoxychorismate synthase component I [Noviherbaspirillum pedocola]|uniref:Aminodeoxychorismate synthase component I n=1 Tax=Noviherbaspirillum pedocola TaxID=2801341 RepID=A0A934T053_9BURK|nr:aminodeoxychorismate synthase component I [Noviherbaspirillum pedocola]MBK4739053.1 aminodeoxychorismate synthase component I [Noviherbaspirillum pedocola]